MVKDSFTGKRALITGGASGIGRATAIRLMKAGCKVVIADLNTDAGGALERDFPDAAVFHHCDVTIEADLVGAVETAERLWGGLDILFNNAGMGGAREGLETISLDAWNETLAVLLTGPLLGIKHAAPVMRRGGGGVIVNTASVAGRESGWGPMTYSVAKGALIHLTTLAAAELGRSNIRVNAILPGLIATGIFSIGQSAEETERRQQEIQVRARDVQPIPKPGSADDVAALVAFLCSDDAAFISGAHVSIDGGLGTGQRHAWDPAVISPVRKILDEL